MTPSSMFEATTHFLRAMVLLALGILFVSLSFLAYRYGVLESLPLLSSFSNKYGAKGRFVAPAGPEKPRPALTLTTPEVSENDTKRPDIQGNPGMRDPFEELEIEQPAENATPPPKTATIPTRTPNLPNGMMAPPSLLPPTSSTLQTPPKPSNPASVRPPPSAASSLRAPPGRSPATSSLLAPSTSTLAPSARPSRKVQLEPGHSPLDWAHLTSNPPSPTFLRGADVPPQLIRVPPSLLKHHNGRKDRETGRKKDAWGVWQGKVYNMTPYMKFHPGGEDQLMRGAGNIKAEALFNETHQWISWESMMGECLVGILVSENEAIKENSMEGVD